MENEDNTISDKAYNDQWLVINTVLMMAVILSLCMISFVAGLFYTLPKLVRFETKPLPDELEEAIISVLDANKDKELSEFIEQNDDI